MNFRILLLYVAIAAPCYLLGVGPLLRSCLELLAARSDVPHDGDFVSIPPPPPPRYSSSWSDERGLAKHSGCVSHPLQRTLILAWVDKGIGA